MCRLVKILNIDSKEIEEGRCTIRRDDNLCFSEKDRGKVLKDSIERIMNDENDWDHKVGAYAVEGPVVCVSREQVVQALNEMKTG